LENGLKSSYIVKHTPTYDPKIPSKRSKILFFQKVCPRRFVEAHSLRQELETSPLSHVKGLNEQTFWKNRILLLFDGIFGS